MARGMETMTIMFNSYFRQEHKERRVSPAGPGICTAAGGTSGATGHQTNDTSDYRTPHKGDAWGAGDPGGTRYVVTEQ